MSSAPLGTLRGGSARRSDAYSEKCPSPAGETARRQGGPCETPWAQASLSLLFSGNFGTTDTFLVPSGSCRAICVFRRSRFTLNTPHMWMSTASNALLCFLWECDGHSPWITSGPYAAYLASGRPPSHYELWQATKPERLGAWPPSSSGLLTTISGPRQTFVRGL